MKRRSSVWAGSVAVGAILAAGLTSPASAATPGLEPVEFPDIGTDVWLFDERDAYDFTKREPTIAPRYLIYPDEAVDAAGAKRLIEDLGIDDHLTEYATRAWVINPTNGVDYEAEADLASYFAFMAKLPTLADHQHTNLKVIGVGNGATFVNDVVSQNSWSLSGIFTYGGTMSSAVEPFGPTPAYIHGDAAAGERYVAANGAVPVGSQDDVTAYADPQQPLARVVVDPSGDETLAEAFDAAWEALLSYAYRPYYPRGRVDPSVTREGFPLVAYPRIGEDGVSQTPVTDPLGTDAEYMWQEYIPASVRDAAPGTVPLLVAMHGTTDMPQHIAERGGWVEQIAEVGAMMVSVENQGSRFGLANFDGPATERLVAHLAEKYPQIDTGRIYATGFSLGGANSQSWGIAHPTLFTAVSGVGAPFGGGDAQIAQAAAAAKPKQEVPFYMLQGVEDGIGQLPVTANARSVYTTIRAYAALNGVDVPTTPDLSLNPHYGIALDDQRWEIMETNEALVGTLSNDRGVMIKLAGVNGLGHVSFAPSAADIWEFFEGYRRDTTTGELHFVSEPEPDAVRPVVSLASPSGAGPFSKLTVQVDASDEGGLAKIVANVYQGSALVASTQSAMNGASTGSHSAVVELADGEYLVKYNAHDLAGNVSSTGSHVFRIDATAPTATVKTGTQFTVATGQTFDMVSYKLHDAGKIDRVEINGTVKNLSDNAWSDVNFIKPGVFGAVAGTNTMVVYDVAGNTQTYTFTLN